MIRNTTQDWIMLLLTPLTKRYHTELLSYKLRHLQTRLHTDTLFHKFKSITGHECDKIYTDGEGFIWIFSLFSYA